jgi:hypothetical protein
MTFIITQHAKADTSHWVVLFSSICEYLFVYAARNGAILEPVSVGGYLSDPPLAARLQEVWILSESYVLPELLFNNRLRMCLTCFASKL